MKLLLAGVLLASCCFGSPIPVFTSQIQSGTASIGAGSLDYGAPFELTLTTDTGSVSGTLASTYSWAAPIIYNQLGPNSGASDGIVYLGGAATLSINYEGNGFFVNDGPDGDPPQFGSAGGTLTFSSDPILVYGGQTTFVIPFIIQLSADAIYPPQVTGTGLPPQPYAEFDYTGSGVATFSFTEVDESGIIPAAELTSATFVFAPEPSSGWLVALVGVCGVVYCSRRRGCDVKGYD